jgi:hypothetical protein
VGSNLALSAEYKVTVSVPTGGNLSSIAFTTSPASQKNNATASNGTFSSGTWTAEGTTTTSVTFTLTSTFRLTEIAVSYTPAPAAPAAPEVTPTANKNEWTFQMPAYDVEVNVEYETALALNEVDDNTEKLAEWNGYEADVTLTRTLAAGGWNTLAVPFNVSSATIALINASLAPDNMVIKKLASTSLEDGTLTLNFENASEIEAGKPYLVKVPTTFAFAATPFAGIIMSNAEVPTETTYADFVPTLGKTLVTGPADNESNAEAVLFLAAENKLKNPTVVNDPEQESSYMKGFRAYFQLKGEAISSARAFSLNLGDGEATGISEIENGKLKIENGVYDLQGRRMESSMFNIQSSMLKKGVYIVDGKKTVVR